MGLGGGVGGVKGLWFTEASDGSISPLHLEPLTLGHPFAGAQRGPPLPVSKVNSRPPEMSKFK